MKRQRFDVVVIGATRAGLAAVETAVARGLSVAIVETCLEGRIVERHREELRLRTSALRGALGDLNDSRNLYREAVRQVWHELASPAWRAGKIPVFDSSEEAFDCPVFDGPARFVSSTCIEVARGEQLESTAFVIAVGASPRHPVEFDFTNRSICDLHQLIQDEEPPRSVTIVGADWAGCEWAFVCASVGAEVTLVDRRSRMLRAVDSEVRSMLQSSLLEMGVDVVLREKITALEVGPHGECQIELGSGRKLVSERLLVLSGQIGNTVDLGFDEIGVQTDESNHVVVDDDYRTSVEGIYAIGSVIDPLGLGHPVTLQAEVAVASATGEPLDGSPYDPAWALYSATEVAMCGLTQEVCAMLDLETVSTSAGCTDTGRGSSRFAKVVVNASTGRILGAQLAGAGAPEAIGLVSSLIGRDVHIEECARISGPEGTLTGLCSDAIRSALAELRTGRFGSEWRLPRGSDGSGGSNVAVSRSNPHAALRSYSTEVRE